MAVPLKQDAGEFSEFLAGDAVPIENGGTAGVTVAAARSNLLLTGRVTSGDADLTLAPTTSTGARVYQLTAALTAARTWTLPAASTLTAGDTLWLEMGSSSAATANALGSFGLTIAAAGTDRLNGGATGGAFLVRQSNVIVLCTTNGSNGWIVAVIQPSATSYSSGGLDAANTFAPTSPVSSFLFTHALTAGRAFNLTAGYPAGWTVTVTRTAAATGAFNLTVQDATTTANAKALAVSQWVEFVSDGTSWNEAAFGSL